MPVRIFTYRVGGDAASGQNMKEMACTNKGKKTFSKLINTYILLR